jgi:hypothetical protein
MAVFWVVHHQGDDSPDDGGSKDLWNVGKLQTTRVHGNTTQKTAFFVLTAVRTSNPSGITLPFTTIINTCTSELSDILVHTTS